MATNFDRETERFYWIQGTIGGLACMLFGGIVSLLFADEHLKEPGPQTIAAGLVAAIAALLSAMAVLAQIRHSQRLNDDARVRKNLRARAAISQPLSNLIEYELSCVMLLNSIPTRGRSRPVAPYSIMAPDYPESDADPLVECIESADITDADAISLVVAKLQIQHARLQSLQKGLVPHSSRVITEHEIQSYILDAIELHGRIEQLIKYARRERNLAAASLEVELMTNAFRLCGFDEVAHEALYEHLLRRCGAVKIPT